MLLAMLISNQENWKFQAPVWFGEKFNKQGTNWRAGGGEGGVGGGEGGMFRIVSSRCLLFLIGVPQNKAGALNFQFS